MKAAFLSEFASVRSTLAQMALIYLACGIFICVGMKSALGMVGAISAMTPFFLTFTFAGYDAMNAPRCRSRGATSSLDDTRTCLPAPLLPRLPPS